MKKRIESVTICVFVYMIFIIILCSIGAFYNLSLESFNITLWLPINRGIFATFLFISIIAGMFKEEITEVDLNDDDDDDDDDDDIVEMY